MFIGSLQLFKWMRKLVKSLHIVLVLTSKYLHHIGTYTGTKMIMVYSLFSSWQLRKYRGGGEALKCVHMHGQRFSKYTLIKICHFERKKKKHPKQEFNN